jgi:hypothetical protein
VNPVFIRRGGVLILLNNTADLIQSVKNGKVRPTDQLLVKDREGLSWIPISTVIHIQSDSSWDETVLLETNKQLRSLFNQIRTPKFNLNAFLTGGFYFLLREQPRLGLQRLSVTLLLLLTIAFCSITLNLTAIFITVNLILGWVAVSLLIGLRADHDLNRHYLQQIYQKTLLIREAISPTSSSDITAIHISPEIINPFSRSKILN